MIATSIKNSSYVAVNITLEGRAGSREIEIYINT
jgi:hypothetical protein